MPVTTTDKVIKEYGRAMVSLEIDFLLNEALQKSCRPHLKEELCYYKRLEGDLKTYGDYICKNILCVWELLRSEDPNLFKKRGPISVAKEIIGNFPKSDMIEGLTLVDVGYLTFKLNGNWMAERICKNLKDGISAWAPISPAKRVIVDFATEDIDAKMHADGVRSTYIRDTLVRMLEYCGVEVSGRMHNEESLHVVKGYFPEEQREIRSRRKMKSLFVLKEEALRKAQPNNVHEDLAALWCGIYVQKAEWIVYVTPIRQREYIKKCFTAAEEFYRDFAAVRDFAYEDHPTMSYLGYQTSRNEQRKLALLWDAFESNYRPMCDFLVQEGMAREYSVEAVFECAIKYAYLKNQTYSDCTFNVRDAKLFREGNTFVYLLKTKALIRSVLKNSCNIDMLKSNKTLVGREREMGLHLLQFTEIIEESFLTFVPHLLCEYLFNLSKNFTSYIHEGQPSETRVLLCNAAEMVMEKGFDLLGITPESSKGLPSYLKQQTRQPMAVRDHYISCPVSRPNLTSRFEMFSMFVEVSDSNFEKGNLFGKITVSDKYGLRSDGWCNVDKNGCGHVAYFDHDWHDAVGIYDTSFLSFGDPVSRHSVPVSSSIEIGVNLWVTSKKKDACYELCNAQKEIKPGFWSGGIERSTFYAEGEDGSVSIYYALLRDAVDTSMRLNYEPTVGDPKVCGHILAYYGGDALDSCDGFEKQSYKAVVFHTEPAKLYEGNLRLKKSTLAVPTNGVLVIEAFLKDADSGKVIVNEKREYHAKPEGGFNEWHMRGENCRFILRVDWIRQLRCSI